jgi:hypothetical protein
MRPTVFPTVNQATSPIPEAERTAESSGAPSTRSHQHRQ